MTHAGASARNILEIKEAIALFESWEKSINDADAAGRFTQAVQLLDDYLEGEPDTPCREFVRNVKIANTRRLLQQLTKVDRKDFATWLEYALMALPLVQKEAEEVMSKQPDLKKEFDAFQATWGDTLREALQRVQRSE